MWPFSRNKKKPLPALVFKSGEDFVGYHCKYMLTDLKIGSPLAALVLDSRDRFGTQKPVSIDERGIQTATLRVASADGGFIVIAQTSGVGDPLQPGDAVAWIPGQHLSQLAKLGDDERSGWVGIIVAKIAPEIDIESGQMTVLSQYG